MEDYIEDWRYAEYRKPEENTFPQGVFKLGEKFFDISEYDETHFCVEETKPHSDDVQLTEEERYQVIHHYVYHADEGIYFFEEEGLFLVDSQGKRLVKTYRANVVIGKPILNVFGCLPPK